jgi:dipeptidyl aminopeptidase/acylaminoacyl peptidase
MFASGSLPGRAVRLLPAPARTGSWSPNGERFVATSGKRVFVGDRNGQVKLLTELQDLSPTSPPIWKDDEALLFSATRTGQQHWVITLDSRSGIVLDQRDVGPGIQPWSVSPDGRWLLAFGGQTASGLLVELATGTRTLPADGESFTAWLPDGRVVTLTRLDRGSRVAARRPEGGAAETLLELDGTALLPAAASGRRLAVIESAARDGTGPRSIWLISAGERPARIAQGLGRVYVAKPSRDGKLVGFSEAEPGTPVRLRTGVIEVATKKVSYACDAGCAGLDVR